MRVAHSVLLVLLAWGLSLTAAWAAPDEAALCKDQGYPVGTPRNWFSEECVRVGSFTHHAEILQAVDQTWQMRQGRLHLPQDAAPSHTPLTRPVPEPA